MCAEQAKQGNEWGLAATGISSGGKVSRRGFLKGAGVLATVGVGIGLAGCGSSPALETPAGGTGAGGGSGNGKVAADFAIAAVPVAEAGEPAKECDYLVLGAGNCGMLSAAHAGELGLKTIVLEKNSVTGGSSVGTEVTMAFDDCKIFQEYKYGNADPNVINVTEGRPTGTPNDIYTYFMMHNSWAANAELVSNYIANNHRPHDFLYEHGARPMMILPSLDAPTGGIMYQGQGIGVFEIMQAAAEEYGVEIITEAPATALVVDGDGAVVGVMADLGGASSFIKAKAVFVGTGGFSNNADMIEALIPGYGPIAWKNDFILKHDGDGIRMMLGVGAAASDNRLAQPAASGVEGAAWESSVDKAAREPYLWVNKVGRRLGNEKWTTMDTTFKVGIKENDYTYFNVIDTKAAQRMQEQPFMTGARTVLGNNDAIPTMIADLDDAATTGIIYKGETLDELAQAAGIDAAALKETVDRYNEMANAGNDTEFYKDPAFLIPIEQGPFYAFKMIPAWYSTLCGVKIDGKIRVLNGDDKPIGGLFAGGLDSGEFYKDNYNHGFSGGCSGYSYFTGFFAADNAAEHIKSL
ncbi:MAG: FAD-binding protein [Coriobacteriales bacterium]|nr:FAD-binding protein [Coriobacteriales bacterium]